MRCGISSGAHAATVVSTKSDDHPSPCCPRNPSHSHLFAWNIQCAYMVVFVSSKKRLYMRWQWRNFVCSSKRHHFGGVLRCSSVTSSKDTVLCSYQVYLQHGCALWQWRQWRYWTSCLVVCMFECTETESVSELIIRILFFSFLLRLWTIRCFCAYKGRKIITLVRFLTLAVYTTS